jgi:hypothetical protein
METGTERKGRINNTQRTRKGEKDRTKEMKKKRCMERNKI